MIGIFLVVGATSFGGMIVGWLIAEAIIYFIERKARRQR